MSVQIPLKQILSALRSSFHSIDVRSAVKKHNSSWLCLLTAIRISARSAEEVTLKQQQLIEESPTIHADPFRVLLQAFPYSEIDSLLNDLTNAFLTVERERIALPQPVSIDQVHGTVSRWKTFLIQWEQEVWPTATYSYGTRSTSLQEPAIAGAVVQNGWPSVESAISHLLGIEKQDLYTSTISVFIQIEMPARISMASIDDKSFEIRVEAEKNLNNLSLHWSEKAFGEIAKKIPLEQFGDRKSFNLLRTKTMQTTSKGDDEFSCWLSHKDIPVIDTVAGRFKDFLPIVATVKSGRAANKALAKPANTATHGMKVFISHINEEASLATGLKQFIEHAFSGECTVFVSSHPKDLPAGTRWLEEISDALESAAVLIVLCSLSSISRPWINFEAGCCWNRKIPIIPVCHSGQRRSNLPPPLSSLQSLELEDENFSERLIHALGEHLAIKPASEIDFQHTNKDLIKNSLSVTSAAPSQSMPAVTKEDTEHDSATFRKLDAIAGEALVNDLLNGRIYTSNLKMKDDDLLEGFIANLVKIENRYLDQTLQEKAEGLARKLDALLGHVRQTFWSEDGGDRLKFYPDPINSKIYDKEWKELCKRIDHAWDAYKEYRLAIKKKLRV